MASFTKDVLYPGTYSVADGKGGRRKVVFDRAKVELLTQRMKDMLAAGLAIPLAAEHQDRGKPLTAEERKAEWVKKLTLGWAEAAELAPEGYLTTRVEVPIAEDARRIPAVRFVSPEIVEDFVDGTGRKWPGPSITHLAVTPRPVQQNQKPFQPVQMSCVRLSLSDYEGEPMDQEPKPNETPKKGEETPSGGGKFSLDELRKVLADDGYGIPDHVTEPEEFLQHLHTAALSKKAMIDKLVDDGEEEPNGGEPAPAPADGPIMMSLGGHTFELRRQGKKGGAKKPAGAGPQNNPAPADPRTSRLEQALLSQGREAMKTRINSLFSTGRVTKPIKDKLLSECGTVRLSLDDAGQLGTNAVLSKVEAYEELPAGSAWPATGALPEGVRGVEPPSGTWNPSDSPAATAEAVDSFFDMLPGAKK